MKYFDRALLSEGIKKIPGNKLFVKTNFFQIFFEKMLLHVFHDVK